VEARAHKYDHGRAATRLRFTFEPKQPFAKRVIAFDAVEMEDPDLETRDTSEVQYLPLQEDTAISLACPLMAPGLAR